jgi:hypothetical protein
MTWTVLYPEKLYADDSVERRIYGPEVRVVFRDDNPTAPSSEGVPQSVPSVGLFLLVGAQPRQPADRPVGATRGKARLRTSFILRLTPRKSPDPTTAGRQSRGAEAGWRRSLPTLRALSPTNEPSLEAFAGEGDDATDADSSGVAPARPSVRR